MHHVYRSAYSVETPYELRDAIAKDLSSSNCPERIMGKPLTVFVFTGQGSQYAGMGRNLFRTCQVFRDSILECNAICTRLGYESFLDLIVNDDVKRLDITPAQSQLALVSLELALVEMWKAWGIIPDIVMGHSLGEYAALCTAGVLSVYDVLYIVGKRGQMMQRKCAPYTHSMLAVESDVDLVRTALEHEGFSGCTISCINSSSSTVVSARLEDLISLRAHFDSVRTSILKVPYAFHSPQVDVILEELESVSTHVRFNKPMIPVISTLTGLAVEDEGVFGPCYLARQAREPVNFLQAMQTCQERFGSDNTTWLEIGPSRVCLDLVRLTLPLVGERTVSTLKPNKDCWETISKAAAQLYTTGADVKWSNYHMEHQKSLHFIEMPTYSFDAKNYWIPYEGDWALMNKDHPATAKALPPFSTTCLQHIAHEAHEDSMSSVTFTSDLSEPSLFETIQGHLVLGLGLCPSSVLTDMAITAASYLFERMEGTKPVPSMDVAKMEIFHPLVVLPGQSNVFLKLHAKRLKGSGCVEVSCNSERASISQQHAHCIVEYGSHATWKKEWAHSQHLVKARSETLVDAAKSGLAHNVLQGMVYKLFANLVLYSERYRSIHEVYMDNNLNEAAATLSFRETESADKFTISPYWVDGIIHLGGFILNGHVNTSQEFTYICTGWDNLRIPTDLSPGHMYSSYAHMQPTGHGLFVGDVFLLRDGETVAGCKSLKFQQIRRTSLQALLSTAAEKSGNNPLATSETTLLPSDESFSEAETNHSSRPVLSRGRNSASIAESPIMDIRGIIAEEADIQGSELPADVSFDELGIDSILKMHICAKIQERTGVILPPSVFDTYPTVTTLLDHIEKDWQSSSATTIDSENTTLSCSPASSVTSANSPEDTDVFDVLLSTICAETGIDSSAMGPSSVFSDLGVDSLIGIAVVSRVRDQTGRMIPSSFFRDHPTISAARNALDTSRPTPSTTDRSSPCKPVICKPDRFSRSVFLQGNPDCKAPALFLVADGSGSPASYHHIPPLPSGIAVYGLESPFCHQPMEWDCSFEDVAAMYKDAIRKVQPHGPYIIAGWSLGGMQAFEISRHLLLEGEQVRGLLLIDAPSPELLMHVPEPTMEVLETIGLFSALRKAGMRGKALVRTQQHLMQSIHSLNNYVPKPMDSEHRPDFVSIIWGTSGVFEELGGKVIEATHLAARNQGTIDPHEMHELQRWMTAPREDFGPNGWERLVGTDVDCYQTEGDHFSMMNPPLVCNTLDTLYFKRLTADYHRSMELDSLLPKYWNVSLFQTGRILREPWIYAKP
jgi:iron transport multicopper oxidase